MPCKIPSWEISIVEGWLRELREQVDKEGGLTEASMKNSGTKANQTASGRYWRNCVFNCPKFQRGG